MSEKEKGRLPGCYAGTYAYKNGLVGLLDMYYICFVYQGMFVSFNALRKVKEKFTSYLPSCQSIGIVSLPVGLLKKRLTFTGLSGLTGYQ